MFTTQRERSASILAGYEYVCSKKQLFLHGFEKCPHTLRGTILLLCTDSTNDSVPSCKTEVFLASAMYS